MNVEAPDDAPQTIENTATVTSTGDNDTSNTVTTDVVPSADIQIVKEANPNPVDLGDNLTFTLNVINRGPSLAPFVRIRDDLPGNVILISVDENKGDDCTVRPGQIIECDFTNLVAGEGRSVLVTVEPEEAGTVRNTARVIRGTVGVVDPNTANNVDTVTVTVEDDAATDDDGTDDEGTDNGGNDNGNNDNGNNDNGNNDTDGEEDDSIVIISGDDNDVGDDAVDGTVPDKVLPFTGGTAGAVFLLGAGAFVLLGALVVRFVRFRSF